MPASVDRLLVRLRIDELEARDLPSAVSDAAYGLLTQRVTENAANFFVYQNADSGFNHGFPSGFFAGDAGGDRPDLRNQIQVDIASVNDQGSPTGTTTDPTRFDRTRGTVMSVFLPSLTGAEFVGLHLQEPEQIGATPSGNGYDLRGADRVFVDARSPTAGGLDVQFGVGGRNTDRLNPYHLTNTFATFSIDLSSLRDPNTNVISPPDLSNLHLVFSVLTSANYETQGGIALLDNIRFDPVPANPYARPSGEQPRPSFPRGNETFGVVPAVIRSANDADAAVAFTGPWTAESGRPNSYRQDRHTITGAASAGIATWTFSGLQPRVYELQTTWEASAGNAVAAPYTLFDSAINRGTVAVNQTQSPTGNPFDGSKWKSLGLVRVESDTLRVQLSNIGVGPGEVVSADGMRIVPVIPVTGMAALFPTFQ